MRIFFVTNNYTPYAGGVVQSIAAITDELRNQGHEVFIITLSFLHNHADDPAYVFRVACPIRFMYKKNYMAIPWRPTHAIERLIAQYKPDIIHMHHPFLLGLSALHAARKYGIACVFTYHTLYEQYAHYIPLPRTYLQPLIQRMVMQFCKKVDLIIAPSSSIKKYLITHQIKRPVVVIPSPLRKAFLANPTTIMETETSRHFNLLLVTRFMPEKNIPFVFQVMKLLPEKFRLTLVGYGAEYEKMRQLAFETFHFSPERIRFIHKPSQDTLLELYRSSDLFIFPSQTDTQGIVLAESMSQGIPIIALDGPGQRDIIIDGINGFIIADAQQCADTIIMLAHQPSLLQQLSEQAVKTAQQYQPHLVVKQLIDAYNSI